MSNLLRTVQVESEALAELQLGPAVLTPSRSNGFLNMLEAMRKRARALSGSVLPVFPSLRISAADITPQGAFAEAQAQFLQPAPKQVDALVKVCNCYRWLKAQICSGFLCNCHAGF